MAVSSACVTGLSVMDLGEELSLFGQLIILFLIQIGGLSYMTMTTILIYMTGKNLSISDTKTFDLSNNSESQINFKDFVLRIGLFTIVLEIIGVILMLKDSLEIANWNFDQGLYHAIFHSISAFCNAGLSLYSNSLEDYGTRYFFLFIFSLLPILGGLGYTVLNEVYEHFINNKSKHKKFIPSLHTKVCLQLTVILLIAGTFTQFFLIYAQNLSELVLHGFNSISELWHNLFVSFFHTTAARSSGFNSISLNDLGEPSLLLLIVWMFFGACPGGTGGGIKVTTLMLIFSMTLSSLKNKQDVTIFNRSIAEIYQKRALVVFVSTIVLIFFFTWLISIWECSKGMRFIDYLFEVTSAVTTVGLSTGITSQLSDPSLLVLCLCMLIGRPGPLLFLMALIPEGTGKELRYPEEGILIG
jgi:trk system potassium uptake protein